MGSSLLEEVAEWEERIVKTWTPIWTSFLNEETREEWKFNT